MAIVTLLGFTPPQRFPPDDGLWEQARIEESDARDGDYTTIDTVNPLDPAVTDPEAPPTYSFTTDNATIGPGGWYRVVWVDDDGLEQPTQPVQYIELPDWAPTINDVAALMRSRLYISGQQHESFGSITRPTASQVQELISIAIVDVNIAIRGDIPTEYAPLARRLTALRAALLAEITYWPEQTNSDDSPYARLLDLYTTGMTSLVDALDDVGAGTETRFGSMPLMSPTVAAYLDVFGEDPRTFLPEPDVWDEV